MKIMISLVGFVLSLAFVSNAVATEEAYEQKEQKLSQDMNALFPPKQPELSKGQQPDSTQLIEPAYFEMVKGDKVTLKWKAVEGVDYYKVQAATDPNFKWLVADEDFDKETSYELTKLQPGQHYFWRVSAVKADNATTHRKSFFTTSMFATSENK